MSNDEDFMSVALDNARLGLGRTSPNPAVGAVIVQKGHILAMGYHQRAGMPHAEIEALKQVGNTAFLQDATLYVTLEPCCHFGRTPPCTEAIIKNGIREVVIGMRDPDLRMSGRGIRLLKKRGILVREGVLKLECEKLNEEYITHRKKRRPFVILKSAATLDGQVATRSGESQWITGPEARRQGHVLRNRIDAILVGIGTVLKDDPKLTTRLSGEKVRDPIRIILDSNLQIKTTAKVLNVRSKAPVWIATTVLPKHPQVARLQKAGAQIIFCRKDREGRVGLGDLLQELGRRNVMSVLVEGGPTVASSFLKSELIDKVVLFLAPTFLGGKGRPLFPDVSIRSLQDRYQLQDLTCQNIGSDLWIEGYFR